MLTSATLLTLLTTSVFPMPVIQAASEYKNNITVTEHIVHVHVCSLGMQLNSIPDISPSDFTFL